MLDYKQTLTRLAALFILLLIILPCCNGGGTGGDNPPPSPAVTSIAATGIGVHAALLNGTVNPQAQATNAWFEWGTDSTLSTPTLTPSQAMGAGTTDQLVSATITNLTFGTTYYYRVTAMNASGTQKGAIANFTTALPNSPPAVTTNAATSVTISGAGLNGTVIPNELATTAVFEWGTDSSLNTFSSTSSQPLGAGTTSVAITASLSGLIPGTTYYFRVVAINSAGTSTGTIVSFNTVAQPPSVSTAAATSITTSSATLNGTVNPNGLAVSDAHFEYGTDPALVSPSTTPTQSMVSGFTGQSINATVSLTAGTTYYFRVVAINSAGTSTGTIVSFNTVAQPPSVSTAAATSITTSSATLNGTVNPNGLAVSDAHFEYGTDPALVSPSTTPTQSMVSGFTGQSINATVSLTAGTTYYFRVVAINSAGTSTGAIVSFTTAAQSLTVATGAATSISATGASLNGTVNPNGLAVNDAHFEYGTSPTLAISASTFDQSLGSGFTDQSIAASLLGLEAGTTYYYRVTAGTSIGTILSFTTSSLGGTFAYNSSGQNAKVTTGDSKAVIFSNYLPVPTNYSGVFSLDFSPTVEYGSGGYISIRLMDSVDTVAYFQLSTKDALVTKVRKGVVVDSAAFPFQYNQGSTYTIKITFSQEVTTFEAFGGTVSLTYNTAANPIVYFEVETTQQDAFYDNIKMETGNPLLEVYFDDFSTDTTGTYWGY